MDLNAILSKVRSGKPLTVEENITYSAYLNALTEAEQVRAMQKQGLDARAGVSGQAPWPPITNASLPPLPPSPMSEAEQVRAMQKQGRDARPGLPVWPPFANAPLPAPPPVTPPGMDTGWMESSVYGGSGPMPTTPRMAVHKPFTVPGYTTGNGEEGPIPKLMAGIGAELSAGAPDTTLVPPIPAKVVPDSPVSVSPPNKTPVIPGMHPDRRAEGTRIGLALTAEQARLVDDLHARDHSVVNGGPLAAEQVRSATSSGSPPVGAGLEENATASRTELNWLQRQAEKLGSDTVDKRKNLGEFLIGFGANIANNTGQPLQSIATAIGAGEQNRLLSVDTLRQMAEKDQELMWKKEAMDQARENAANARADRQDALNQRDLAKKQPWNDPNSPLYGMSEETVRRLTDAAMLQKAGLIDNSKDVQTYILTGKLPPADPNAWLTNPQ